MMPPKGHYDATKGPLFAYLSEWLDEQSNLQHLLTELYQKNTLKR